MSQSPTTPERFISSSELKKYAPFSRQHIARLEEAGAFPKRIHFGQRRVAWRESDIIAWQAACVAGSHQAGALASAAGKHARAARNPATYIKE